MIQRACARAGFAPRVVARASDFGVLLSLIAAGAGVTLVPGLAARQVPPRVRLVPPAEPVTRRIFTVSRRGGDRKPAVRVVLDALSAAALPAEALSAAAPSAEAGPAAAPSAEAGPAAVTPERESRRAG
jgi:DNA-binding transcriptional LysR family regulator